MTKEENLKLLEALLEIENKILDKIKEQKDAQVKMQEQKILGVESKIKELDKILFIPQSEIDKE